MVYRVKVLPLSAPLGNAIPSQVPYPIVTNEANMAWCWSMGMRKEGRRLWPHRRSLHHFFEYRQKPLAVGRIGGELGSRERHI